MTPADQTKICTACFQERPREDFPRGRANCRACHATAWTNYKADRRDRERMAELVRINRLINSIPVPRS